MRSDTASLRPATLLSAGLVLFLAGCTVGPDFVAPAAPADRGFDKTPLSASTQQSDGKLGAAQRFANGADLPGEWWSLFGSPALDRLIREALAANPDLRAADAALRQAQQLAAAEGGNLLPSVSADLQQQRVRSSGAAQGLPAFSELYNVTTANLSVSYNVDVFGGTRRGIEAADAQALYQRWQREAAILSLTANIVTTAMTEASLRAQIKATEQIIAAEDTQTKVVQNQFTLGGAAKTDVLSQQSLLAQTRATLPNLRKQLDQQRHLLATYAGRSPADAIDAEFTLDDLTLPADLPVSLPAKLVEQRPDIQAASATLHYASAEIGVAVANQWPQLTLSADWGSAAAQAGKLFTPGNGAWSLGAALTQPIFQGGALGHRRDAAQAYFDEARAQYDSTVLGALRNVSDSLRALQADAETLDEQNAYFRTASASLKLARARFSDGAISHLVLLDAERSESQAQIALVQAQAARLSDTAALFQALGGGWWNRPDTAAPKPDLIAPLF
jgi:NodT family efflux transporter outer membrane factor (OMF) lipoprotein